MADPVPRKPHDPPRNGRLAADASRKGVFPLIWLLLVAALLAAAMGALYLSARHRDRVALP